MTAAPCDCSASAAHDDPVSAARRHALRAVDQQQQPLRGSGFAAFSQQRQESDALAVVAQHPQQLPPRQQQQQQAAGMMPDLSTLVLYIFSPTDPGPSAFAS